MADDPSATRLRSRLFADIIKNRVDVEQRQVIKRYAGELEYEPLDELMISPVAWDRAKEIGVPPELVFAHPDILQAHPKTSLYYRGISLLSRKRVAQTGVGVADWEKGTRKAKVGRDRALKAAQLYNAMISSIIEGSTDWTLDNGYRNIVATMGITLDGMFRNQIGKMAETLVKNRIVKWLKNRGLISSEEPSDGTYQLPKNTVMRFGSEPDIDFTRDGKMMVTIEVKGGTDSAGALERLGAMTKSFAETPPGCTNFLVAGVITPNMRSRLDEMGVVKVYTLDDISGGGDRWEEFAKEVFHYTLRVI